MPFVNMWRELLGDVPGIAPPFAQTLVQQALRKIEDEQLWSFQLIEGGWLTPGLLGAQGNVYASPGTITVQPFSTSIVGDSVATALWLAQVGRPFLTEQQIRVPAYSLYNIIAYDNGQTPGQGNYPYATLTIDRPWMEPAQVGGTYMIYQAYFALPFANFKKFVDVRDTTNNAPMDYWSRDQRWLSIYDAQRTCFDQPSSLVPYKVDQRQGSATFGNMVYEMWPHPLSQLPYTFEAIWGGPSLVSPTDTVPYPLTEEMVKWRAKGMAYLWKESAKGDDIERGSGADWRFLAQAADAQYKILRKQASLLDQQMLDLYWGKFNRNLVSSASDGYETTIGTLNVGSW